MHSDREHARDGVGRSEHEREEPVPHPGRIFCRADNLVGATAATEEVAEGAMLAVRVGRDHA